MTKPRYESMQDIFKDFEDEPTKQVLTQLLKNGILSASTVKEMISNNEIIVPKSAKTILMATSTFGVVESDIDSIDSDNLIDQNTFFCTLNTLTPTETIFTIVDADMYIKIRNTYGIY